MGRRKKFEDKHSLIVETSARLFEKYGFERTTMDDIAREAGIGKGTIYTEFKTKDEIMNHVIAAFAKGMVAKLDEIAHCPNSSPVTLLKAVLLETTMQVYDHAKANFHRGEIQTMPHINSKDREFLKPLREEEQRIIAGLLERAAQKGEIIASKNYLKLATLLRRGLSGFQPTRMADMLREEVKQDASLLIDIFIAGLKHIPVG